MQYGVIFDCDGVLADTESVICRATIDMFRELYGVEMKPDDFRPFIGTGSIRYTEGPAALYGLTIDLDKAVSVREHKFLDIIASGGDIAFPGTLELIESLLLDPAWRVGIATSSGRHKSQMSLKAAGVPYERFDGYVSGDDVEHKKPAPDIFLKAAESLQVPPGRCIGIEDSREGVQAVKAAGMVCVAVTNTFSEAELSQADVVLDSLSGVDQSFFEDLVRT